MSGNGPRQKCPSFSSSHQQNYISDDMNDTNTNNASANPADYILAPPILSKNRYGREELLALFSNLETNGDTEHKPHERLKTDFTDFFVEELRKPICLLQYSETEKVTASLI